MKGRPVDHATATRAADLLREGRTLLAIAKEIGVNPDSITRALRRHLGVKPAELRPDARARGIVDPGDTLKLIPRVLELRSQGFGLRDIAARLTEAEGRVVTENALRMALARAGVKLGRARPKPTAAQALPTFLFGSGGVASTRRRKCAADKPAVPVGPPPAVNGHPLTKADVARDLEAMVAAWHAAGHRIAVCPPTARGEELPHVDSLAYEAGQAASQRQLAAQKRKRAATARRLTGEG